MISIPRNLDGEPFFRVDPYFCSRHKIRHCGSCAQCVKESWDKHVEYVNEMLRRNSAP